MKSYGQRCPISRALDVVGDRWALLVLRELQLGPRRYTDLLEGLPGIGTNVLGARLRELEAAGVVAKRTLPPPTRATVYQATEAGRAIAPVLQALREWGDAHGRPAARNDSVRASWLLAPLSRRALRLPRGSVCELRIGDEVFQVRATRDGVAVIGGAADSPDAVVTLRLRDLVTGATSRAQVEGKADIAGKVLRALAQPSATASP